MRAIPKVRICPVLGMAVSELTAQAERRLQARRRRNWRFLGAAASMRIVVRPVQTVQETIGGLAVYERYACYT
jgi:hypothetical protein